MGQVWSTENDVSQLKEAVGCALYDAMLEGDAVPDLGVVHPLLLASQDESINPGSHLQEQLRHVNRFFLSLKCSGLKMYFTLKVKLFTVS